MMLIFPAQKNHLFHILMVKFLEQFIPEIFLFRNSQSRYISTLMAGKCVGETISSPG